MWVEQCVGKSLLCVVCIVLSFVVCDGKPAEGEIRINSGSSYAETCRLMLQDNESSKILFDAEERSFYVNEPLQVRLVRKRHLLVRFFSPRPVNNVVIWGRWKGMPEQVKLAEFEVLPAFAEYLLPVPCIRKDAYFLTRSGRRVFVPEKRQVEELETEIECTDPYFRKITSTKCHWRISFGAYQGKNWTPLLPAHAREAVAIALNLAYLFSTEEFKRELFAAEGRLYADNCRTQVDVEKLYKRIFELPALVYGHVTGVNGLGGGSVFGLAEWCYLEHYADDNCVTRTIFHEFAHCLGYNHAGNMTYENGLGKGWVALCSGLYTRMSIDEELPVYSRRFLSTRGCPYLYNVSASL